MITKLKERQRVCGLLSTRFPSCARDDSGRVWHEEGEIVCRLLRGQRLVTNRQWEGDGDRVAVSWYWGEEPIRRGADILQAAVMAAEGTEARERAIYRRDLVCWKFGRPWYRDQWDGPVMRLMGREVLKPRTCGGGFTEMVFTERAAEVFGPETEEAA